MLRRKKTLYFLQATPGMFDVVNTQGPRWLVVVRDIGTNHVFTRYTKSPYIIAEGISIAASTYSGGLPLHDLNTFFSRVQLRTNGRLPSITDFTYARVQGIIVPVERVSRDQFVHIGGCRRKIPPFFHFLLDCNPPDLNNDVRRTTIRTKGQWNGKEYPCTSYAFVALVKSGRN